MGWTSVLTGAITTGLLLLLLMVLLAAALAICRRRSLNERGKDVVGVWVVVAGLDPEKWGGGIGEEVDELRDPRARRRVASALWSMGSSSGMPYASTFVNVSLILVSAPLGASAGCIAAMLVVSGAVAAGGQKLLCSPGASPCRCCCCCAEYASPGAEEVILGRGSMVVGVTASMIVEDTEGRAASVRIESMPSSTASLSGMTMTGRGGCDAAAFAVAGAAGVVGWPIGERRGCSPPRPYNCSGPGGVDGLLWKSEAMREVICGSE